MSLDVRISDILAKFGVERLGKRTGNLVSAFPQKAGAKKHLLAVAEIDSYLR